MFDKNWETLIYKKNKQINNYPFDWIVSSTKKYIKNCKKKKVIELGCGTGNNLMFFKKNGFKIIEGIEGSKTASSIAKNRFKKQKNVIIFNKDFSKFIFKKENYDLFIDRGSLTHNKKQNIKEIIDKIYFSLKPKGFFFSSLFSKKHYAYSKKKTFFKKEIRGKSGLITSFLDLKDIRIIFKRFKLVSLIHETKNELMTKKKNCWWYIVAYKS